MTILFYRYGSICEPDIIHTFRKMNVNVAEETAEMTDKALTPSKCVELVSRAIEQHRPAFVFSINFFPAVAEVCQLYRLLYLCWTVDSPVLELFSKSIRHDTNRIFLFDRAQYELFSPYHPDGIFHLPLASAVERFDSVTASISQEDRALYRSDISFVGSLYTEKNPLRPLRASTAGAHAPADAAGMTAGSVLPQYICGYIDGIVDASLQVMGYNFMESLVTDEIISALKDADSSFYCPKNPVMDGSRYVAAHQYIGMQAAETERIRTLRALAEFFHVDLYTRSDISALQASKQNMLHVHGGIKTLTEMPKVFRLSKINLNMTIKPIRTGLPLRIFDILGCGGFCMTNYQAELTEHFEIGVDLEAYSSLDELVDKCSYYLTHEEQRAQIAQNGYEKVRHCHTYPQRILSMLKAIRFV